MNKRKSIKITKVPIDRDLFMDAINARNISIRRLGPLIGYNERTIRRHLKDGYMTTRIILDICRILDIRPTWIIDSKTSNERTASC